MRLKDMSKMGNFFQSFDEKYFYYFLLALIPFVLMISSTEWMFTYLGNLDSPPYIGYSLHYADPSFHNWYYKIARMPWVLYQFLSYHMFGSLYSAYFIQISCLLIAVFFVYSALIRIFSSLSAFFGSSFLGLLTLFHGSGGADYNNTLAGPLYAVSYYLFLRAIHESKPRLYFLFGVFIALTIHTNITFLNLLPGLLFLWYGLERDSFKKNELIKAVKYACYGGVAITLLLSLIQLSVGRTPFFFLSLFKVSFSYIFIDTAPQLQWWQPWSSFWFLKMEFHYIVLYLVSGLICLMTLVTDLCRNRFRINSAFLTKQNIILTHYVLSFLIYIVWQTMGHTALQPDYFPYVLIIPMVSAIAALFDDVRLKKGLLTGFILPIFIIVCFAVPLIFETGARAMIANLPTSFVSTKIIIYVLAFMFLIFAKKYRSLLILSVLLFSIGNSEMSSHLSDYRKTEAPFSKWGRVSIIDAHLKLMSEADDFFKNRPPAPQVIPENPTFYDTVKALLSKDKGYYFRIKTWFNYDDTMVVNHKTLELNQYATSLSSTGITYLSDLPLKSFKDIPEADLQKAYDDKDLIVLITTSKKPIKDLRKRVKAMGKKLKNIDKFTVPFGPAEIPFQLVTITD